MTKAQAILEKITKMHVRKALKYGGVAAGALGAAGDAYLAYKHGFSHRPKVPITYTPQEHSPKFFSTHGITDPEQHKIYMNDLKDQRTQHRNMVAHHTERGNAIGKEHSRVISNLLDRQKESEMRGDEHGIDFYRKEIKDTHDHYFKREKFHRDELIPHNKAARKLSNEIQDRKYPR